MVPGMAAIRSRFADRARRWARRRQGSDGRSVHLTQQRVYILPTATGLILALVIFTMLLGALNYSNNMGFALTFLMAGLGLVAMRECHRNLAGLDVQLALPTPVFAGQEARIELRIHRGPGPDRFDIGAGWSGGQTYWADLLGEEPGQLSLPLATDTRGYMQLPSVRISTCWPFGLFRCWAWIYPSTRLLVYPAPAANVPPTPELPPDEDGDTQSSNRPGTADFLGIREYRAGDARSRIAWRATARRGELMVKEHVEAQAPMDWFDWDYIRAPDEETRIRRLTRLCLKADGAGRPFGLRIPGTRIPPGRGAAHLHQALASLATLGHPAPGTP